MPRSKVEVERLTDAARAAGMTTAILRFSNVFGDALDHPDRVVPAFARAAATGGTVRVTRGLHFRLHPCVGRLRRHPARGEAALRRRARLAADPLRVGRQTSLGQLADLSVRLGRDVTRVEAPARSFDVHRFYGDPRRAEALLGWRATTPLETGFARLMEGYRLATAEPAHAARARD